MCGTQKETRSQDSASSYLLTSPLEITQFDASQDSCLGLCNRTSSVSKSLNSLLVGPGFRRMYTSYKVVLKRVAFKLYTLGK